MPSDKDIVVADPDKQWYTETEFKASFPDRAFTWDLDEHPEDGSGDICACQPCRELSYED